MTKVILNAYLLSDPACIFDLILRSTASSYSKRKNDELKITYLLYTTEQYIFVYQN